MREQPVHLHVLLPADLDEQLREAAAANFRSVSGEVRAAIAERFKAAEPPRPVAPWEGAE